MRILIPLAIMLFLGTAAVEQNLLPGSFSTLTSTTLQVGGGSTLTDSSQVALLNAQNTFTAVGTNAFGGGGSGGNSEIVINGSSASTAGAYLEFQKNGTQKGRLGHSSALLEGGTTDNLVLIASSSAGIVFGTNATGPRWGINSAGDFTVGSANHIADSIGTPTLGGGWGSGASIVGTDYAMLIQTGTLGGGIVNGIVGFGHTWSTAPVCTVAMEYDAHAYPVSISTSSVTLAEGQISANDKKMWILCRGY